MSIGKAQESFTFYLSALAKPGVYMQYRLVSLVKDLQTDPAVIPTSHLIALAAHSTLPGERTHIKDFPPSPTAAHLPAAEAGTWVKIQ